MNKKDNSISSSNRREFLKNASLVSLGAGLINTDDFAFNKNHSGEIRSQPILKPNIKITDIKCAIMGNSPVIRVTTDAGIDGYGQAETAKPYLKPFVLIL